MFTQLYHILKVKYYLRYFLLDLDSFCSKEETMSQKPSKNEISRPKSALDAVVNQLVRASVGGVPSTIPDDDLDKYVADLILKEAAVKNKQYNKEGVRAYLP